MEELFTILSSSARLDKSKRKNNNKRPRIEPNSLVTQEPETIGNKEHQNRKEEDEDSLSHNSDNNDDDQYHQDHEELSSRDRTGKRDVSEEKLKQVHKEQMAAFRRSMAIRVANKHDPQLPDPISSFDELKAPSWWSQPEHQQGFQGIASAVQRNIEEGRWKEPTPIQMQSIPALLERRDLIGAAPTGSGKSGAFIIPALVLSSAPFKTFYAGASNGSDANNGNTNNSKKNKKKNKKASKVDSDDGKSSREGEIRSLLLAPSRELAAQLHREVDRLGLGKPGGISSMLLSKSNVSHVIAGTAGGKNGLDVLVSTPLRLVDAVEKGLRLDSIRLVVLDEADRLLDAADGAMASRKHTNEESDDEIAKEEEEEGNDQPVQKSGSSTTQTFLAQMDVILSAIPPSAVRALFSATVTPTVRSLAESVLRNPIDLKIASAGSNGGANTDIEQELMFVGREEGKLLAMRQLKERGQLKPPCIVFVQSQDRAQALFAELLYEGMHVDVIHAGRSQSARDAAVAKFRKGETWVLICTDLVARGVDFRAVNMVINYDLPSSGITYVHRIGRTGRAGRKGKAITLFTEADFDNLRTIANVMKQSGCKVEDWMLQLRKKSGKDKKKVAPRRPNIDTTPSYDKRKNNKKRQMIQQSKKRKSEGSA